MTHTEPDAPPTSTSAPAEDVQASEQEQVQVQVQARTDIDRELVYTTNRVGIWTTGGIFLYVVALLQGYPFPEVIEGLRGPVYLGIIGLLTVITLVLLFLGYRFITLRVVRRVRSIYPTLLPSVALGSFVIGLLFLAAPGLR